MALITDPDFLADSSTNDNSTEVFIDTANLQVHLNTGIGDLIAADGVTGRALYSFLKEEWTNDPLGKNLAAFPFPLVPITSEFYEWVEGWDFADNSSRQSIRNAGWLVRNTNGNVTSHYANVAALGSINGTDQLYFDTGAGATDFTFTGAANESIQIISDPNGDGDYADGFNRSGTFAIYNRERAQLFSSSNLAAIGVTDLLAPKSFAFPVGTGTDLNISATDVTISGTVPYTGMSVTFFGTAQSRTIGSTSRDFGIIIDGNNGTKQEIYEFVQWALRQSTDQDSSAGTLVGNVMPELLEFVGSTLKTKAAENYQGGGTGVYIDNFSAVDTNNLIFVDNGGAERTFPFVAAGNLEFNINLQNDSSARYFMYFTDGVTSGLEWGNSGAIFVQDNSGADIEGTISGNSTISFDFDYDGNTQGGRTIGTDANVTVVAIGLDTAQHVIATGTITRSNSNVITLVSAIERQYENAA